MRRLLLVLSLAALSVVCWSAAPATAQEAKHARGTLTMIAPDSITVKVANTDMKFSVDDKTTVEATGAGTKSRQAATSGKPGPKLADVLKTGQAVEVTYHDMGGVSHASMVRRVSTPGSAGVPGTTSSGTVTAISDKSLTIKGSSGGGGSFTQTFTIDAKTNVVGKGLGTAAAKKGGRTAVTELVHNGDMVSVSYRDEGGTLYANNVRVTMPATR